ncbi:aminopeptidase N [Psychrobacter sp. 230]|nr:aminopeptidase N [Psychrobacter sp. Urea-trap-18]MBA6286253.1 aminopeptidase N [Psychrobacter sp. Urea-trap-16]MBA6317402.1 aminopeptidase N [Psychrobacter sp. Urea-trap-20]MBA6334570.1 aminopeptidase N [Psychrobacter sp. Urea-trap-19]PKG60886.1 aminopeptidase N [Psychrobacter sp. Choline-3u-12]TEW86032.1 aminopeptidase N [Psychrobacter sp. 230]
MSTAETDAQIINPEMPDVPPHAPSKINLKDYTKPSFDVDTVHLDIKLFEDYAQVDSTLEMVRQTAGDIVLFGESLELLTITMNGKTLSTEDYQQEAGKLTIHNAPERATLDIQVRICPQTNTTLEGLYMAGSSDDTMFVTQCEPEGFRKITFYPDRPDVLAIFTTRLEADKRYPTLLANGNLVEAGEVADAPDRHYAIWHDPTNKPSYLFACVVADLDVLTDSYTTSEGREVLLELYAKSADIDKCDVGMQALKDAMKWDEVNYGRAYDLDRYMIVAVSQFNMGAMENKGLNIFNTACVLSSPETTTDARSFSVKAIIAHEYFHNWTGNRITCRDWFQLCLKEGFTVYRDQSFSADQQSSAVQRIDDVATLRAHQFSEDAGPLAHPVRPESFVEINNFYTTTVYEKGAEIVRMIANTLGPDDFRKGTDEYFRRYDGQAVTVEDFLSALSITDDKIENFIDWYRQPGTPVVSGSQTYDSAAQTLTITLNQQTRHVKGFDAPKPLPIPVATALFDKDSGAIVAERMLLLDEATQTFVFENVASEPVVSLLRDFSAPVQLNYDYQDADLAFLLKHETNGFNRWQVTQMLVNRILLQGQGTKSSPDVYLEALAQILPVLAADDAMLAARLLDIPSAQELASAISKDYDPVLVKEQRDGLYKQVADKLKGQWAELYNNLPMQSYEDSAEARGIRALRNVVLDMALTANVDDAADWAQQQYDNASCMTERFGALKAMVNHQLVDADKYLADFYDRFQANDLVVDLWFSVQAAADDVTPDMVKSLLTHTDFDWNTPNRVRSVISAFSSQPTVLWTAEGLEMYTGVIQKLDDANPVLASRLLQVLARWNTLAEPRRQIAHEQLVDLQKNVSSKHVLESLESVLGAANS